MTSTLFVFFDLDFVGKIILDDHRQWIFQYDSAWLGNAHAFPLSLRLPLQEAPFQDDLAKPFFSNLLPEGEVRRLIAAKYGISPANDFAMLSAIGGDCAGAFSIYPEDMPPTKKGNYREVTESELDRLIKEMPKRPLLLADGKARLSLAGAQDKLPIYYENKKFYLPEEGAPSSHILKPPIPHWEDTVLNEAFSMHLARVMGLKVPHSEVQTCKGTLLYLVRRYDREGAAMTTLKRLHQEDFCQGLGKYSDQKYQNEGGPSFADCFSLLEKYSLQPAVDKKELIQWAIYNYLIGNCDAHAKNLSLMISPQGVRLAPFYDLMSTRIYEGLSEKLAMKIGGKYDPDHVFERHWEKFAEDAGVKPRIVFELLNKFSAELIKHAETEYKIFVKNFGGEITLKNIVQRIQKTAKRVH